MVECPGREKVSRQWRSSTWERWGVVAGVFRMAEEVRSQRWQWEPRWRWWQWQNGGTQWLDKGHMAVYWSRHSLTERTYKSCICTCNGFSIWLDPKKQVQHVLMMASKMGKREQGFAADYWSNWTGGTGGDSLGNRLGRPLAGEKTVG